MNFILSLLVFGILYWLLLIAAKGKYWGIAIAEYMVILCLVIVNKLFWKNDSLIFFNETTALVFIGAGGAALMLAFLNHKDKGR